MRRKKSTACLHTKIIKYNFHSFFTPDRWPRSLQCTVRLYALSTTNILEESVLIWDTLVAEVLKNRSMGDHLPVVFSLQKPAKKQNINPFRYKRSGFNVTMQAKYERLTEKQEAATIVKQWDWENLDKSKYLFFFSFLLLLTYHLSGWNRLYHNTVNAIKCIHVKTSRSTS